MIHKKKQPVLIDNAPLGYLTAYRRGESNFDDPSSSGPDAARASPIRPMSNCSSISKRSRRGRRFTTCSSCSKPMNAMDQGPLPRSFARQLLAIDPDLSLDGWLSSLPLKARQHDREHARRLVLQLRDCLEPESVRRGARSVERDERSEQPPTLDAPRSTPHAPRSTVHGSRSTLTFAHTGNRAFEEKYWKTIASLSSPEFRQQEQCRLRARQADAGSAVKHVWRDLEGVGRSPAATTMPKLIADRGMSDVVRFGELPFRWQTEYQFPWMGGWLHNQEGKAYERNLLVMIPGHDRSRAVIMADHYDTAYMQDWYEKTHGRHRGPAVGGRRRRQLLGHGSPDARRPGLSRTEPAGPAGLRRLAAAPDRRRISRGGIGHLPDVPVARRGNAGAARRPTGRSTIFPACACKASTFWT